jgi:acetyl-CoA synthetase
MTYAELSQESRRLAAVLAAEGVGAGDRVAVLLAKSPGLLVTLLAIWRLGAVHVPLFTAFGPDAVAYRVAHSEARVVVTDDAHRPKVPAGVAVLAPDAVADREPPAEADRAPDDAFVLLYTSGTTGHPKGVEVPVRAIEAFRFYVSHGLGVRPDDVYWNVADPGWAYGLYVGVVAPLAEGREILWRTVPFAAEDLFDALLRHGVTNLAGAPTVYRTLRAASVPAGFRDAHRLRAISSAGEPLDAELLDWSRRALGVAIHDHYGQSELGMVVYFPQDPAAHREPVAGSMGIAAPGIRAVVLTDDGVEAPVGTEGQLAIDTEQSPAFWFRGYFSDPQRTAERFAGPGGRYYLTGDAAHADGSGLLFFASRADDVITSSGYRIGPFEVETALTGHPRVAEAAVIGTPDPLRVEAVTAYVVPVPGTAGDAALADALQAFVKTRLAKHLFPRRVVFVDALPRTPSGKVRRTELRADWADRVARGDAVTS